MNDTHNIHEIDNMNNKNITWKKFPNDEIIFMDEKDHWMYMVVC